MVTKECVVSEIQQATHGHSPTYSGSKVFPTLSVGDIVCQGDIALEFLGDNYTVPNEMKQGNRRKIAMGNGPGAQHLVSSQSKARVFWNETFDQPPVIQSLTRLIVEHRGGNHSHQWLDLPEGWYQVRWQQEIGRLVLD